jgi:hypothetical protein
VTPGYFATLRTPLLAGRALRESDRDGARRVALVNDRFVRTLLGGRAALGRRVELDGDAFEIVGVVADQRAPGVEPRAILYLAYAQSTVPPDFMRAMTVVVRAAGTAEPAAAVREALRAFDPLLPVAIAPMEDRLAAAAPLARARFNTAQLALVGGVAALLAALGIQGVLAFAARRRRLELCVRQALGARPTQIAALVLRRALALALAGSALGALAALAVARLLAARFAALGEWDAMVLAAAAVLVVAAALLAGLGPALSAARVPPAAILR